MFDITINDPDDQFAMPIYEGDDELVHRTVIPGDYVATWHDLETDFPNVIERLTIVRVTETSSEFVCVNCGETVSDCTIGENCAECVSVIPE